MAQELERREREKAKFESRGQKRDIFKEQSASGMERAVAKGRMTVTEFHERQYEIRSSEARGTDTTRCVKFKFIN